MRRDEFCYESAVRPRDERALSSGSFDAGILYDPNLGQNSLHRAIIAPWVGRKSTKRSEARPRWQSPTSETFGEAGSGVERLAYCPFDVLLNYFRGFGPSPILIISQLRLLGIASSAMRIIAEFSVHRIAEALRIGIPSVADANMGSPC
jgi:hypothetical protein